MKVYKKRLIVTLVTKFACKSLCTVTSKAARQIDTFSTDFTRGTLSTSNQKHVQKYNIYF